MIDKRMFYTAIDDGPGEPRWTVVVNGQEFGPFDHDPDLSELPRDVLEAELHESAMRAFVADWFNSRAQADQLVTDAQGAVLPAKSLGSGGVLIGGGKGEPVGPVTLDELATAAYERARETALAWMAST